MTIRITTIIIAQPDKLPSNGVKADKLPLGSIYVRLPQEHKSPKTADAKAIKPPIKPPRIAPSTSTQLFLEAHTLYLNVYTI